MKITPDPMNPAEVRCWTCRHAGGWEAEDYEASGHCLVTGGAVKPNGECGAWGGVSPCAVPAEPIESGQCRTCNPATVRRDGSQGGSLLLSPYPSQHEEKARD